MPKDSSLTEPTAKLPSETTVGDIPCGSVSFYDRIKASLENLEAQTTGPEQTESSSEFQGQQDFHDHNR